MIIVSKKVNLKINIKLQLKKYNHCQKKINTSCTVLRTCTVLNYQQTNKQKKIMPRPPFLTVKLSKPCLNKI